MQLYLTRAGAIVTRVPASHALRAACGWTRTTAPYRLELRASLGMLSESQFWVGFRHLNSSWFDLTDAARHGVAARVWIVLRQLEPVEEVGDFAEPGWLLEFQGVASAMFPASAARKAARLVYNDLNSGWPHRPWVQAGRFTSAGVILPERDLPTGRYLVLQQRFDGSPVSENWHLDQDLVLGLGLVRTSDEWIAPAEDSNVVARLIRDGRGRPVRLEILAEFLRDFLTARNSGLVITSYMSRSAVLDDASGISWQSGARRDVSNGHWEGFTRAVHPSGLPYGEKISVTRVFRTDTNDAGDAPTFNMFDDHVSSEHYERGHSGGPFFHVEGSLHRTEWFGPGKISVRVRGDREPLIGIAYRTSPDGASTSAEDLLKPPVRYLYFRPEVMREFLGRPSGSLSWFTRQTGQVEYRGQAVPFGVAENGLVNVVGSDIAELPASTQRIWLAHNVTPDGPVSAELLSAQMSTKPAATLAPEALLRDVLEKLDETWYRAFGTHLVKAPTGAEESIERACNRFQALNDHELSRLAKDLSRFFIERFDEACLKKIAPLPANARQDERRSLGLIEDILKSRNLNANSVSILRALNELRQDDSHIPASDRTRAVRQLGLNAGEPYPHRSARLITATLIALDQLTTELASLPAPAPCE